MVQQVIRAIVVKVVKVSLEIKVKIIGAMVIIVVVVKEFS